MNETEVVSFRLYLAGSNVNSRQALTNLRSLCEEYLEDRYKIEIVDVFEQPERALQEGIILTPALVILSLEHPPIVVGNLSRREVILEALGI